MARKIGNQDNIEEMYTEEELEELASKLGSTVDNDQEFDDEEDDDAHAEFEDDDDDQEYEDEEEEEEEEEPAPPPVKRKKPRPTQEKRKPKLKPKAPVYEDDEDDLEVEEEKPKPRKPAPKPAQKPKAPRKAPATLGEYEELEKYKKTDAYRQEQAREDDLQNTLSDHKEIRKILQSSSVDTSDLGSITIQDTDRTITSKQNMSYLRAADPTYQVVLNQSAYIADMKSLKFRDIFALSNSVSNSYTGVLDKYQTYFRAMSDNSVGVTDFVKWTEVTSLYDVPTMEFGIFNQTFPGNTEFDIKCSSCSQTMKNVGISNDSLISTRNDEVYEQLDRVINNLNNLDKTAEFSLVNKINRFQLPESSTVIDIHIPTVADYLKLLEQVPEGKLSTISNYIDVLLFIKDVFVVDIVETKEQGKPVFNSLETRNEVLAFLKDMGLDDVAKLNKEIGDRDRKYRIDYQIQSFDCQHCGKQTGNIDIDIESLLFEEAVAKMITP